jgi:hypothetical protein
MKDRFQMNSEVDAPSRDSYTESDEVEIEIGPPEPLWNEQQAAIVLNVSPRTLQADRQRGGGIPFIKLGRIVRYDPKVVRRRLRAQTRTSTSQK